jgi:hypothetical protein
MTGIAQTGAQIQLNSITKAAVPVVSGSAPVWVPGMYWINTSSGNAIMEWNGAAWVALATTNFLALCTADPTGLSTIAALTEDTTSGYSRVAVSFVAATASTPSVAVNSNLVSFGPYTANQSLPCQWAALVTVASGSTGLLLDSWTLTPQEQVLATQTIDIAAGTLQLTQS